MKKHILSLIPLFLGGILFAQTSYKNDSVQFRKIADEVLTNGTAYSNLHDLTKNIGARLSGSDAYEKAVDWAVLKLKEAGADKVWKQPVMVPVWYRGAESLYIKEKNGSWTAVNMLSLGNSEGTGGKDVTAQIIAVKDKAEFDRLPADQVKGKIVLFNYPFNPRFVSTGEAYGDAGIYRVMMPTIYTKFRPLLLVRRAQTGWKNWRGRR